MMKRHLLTFFFLSSALVLFAQGATLLSVNQERLQRQRVSMLVLGGWAVGNIAVGAALYGSRQGEERYFHLMNAAWNTVNLGLATAGYLGATGADPAAFDAYETVRAQYNLQKIFLFNAGLDVGYMLGGLYLMERAKNTANKPERLRGFGRSIILQGAFLFAFDLGAYFVQASQNEALQPLLSSIQFTGDGVGLVWRW